MDHCVSNSRLISHEIFPSSVKPDVSVVLVLMLSMNLIKRFMIILCNWFEAINSKEATDEYMWTLNSVGLGDSETCFVFIKLITIYQWKAKEEIIRISILLIKHEQVSIY